MAAARRFVLLPVLVALVAGALAFALANHVHASDADSRFQPPLQGPQQVSPPDEISPPQATSEPAPTCVPMVIPTPEGGFSPPIELSGPYMACFPASGALPDTGTGASDNNPYAIAIVFALGAGFLALIGAAAYATAHNDRRGE